MKTSILPQWAMHDIYISYHDEALYQDIKNIQAKIDVFVQHHKAYYTDYNGVEFYGALQELEEITDSLDMLLSYATILFTTNMHDENIIKFYQDMTELHQTLQGRYLFFTLYFAKISTKKWQGFCQTAPALQRYTDYFNHARSYKKYQFSNKMEHFVLQKESSSSGAFIRLYDEVSARLQFPFNGAMLEQGDILHKMTSNKRIEREQAAHSLGQVYKEHAHIFSLTFNALLKDFHVNATARGYKQPIHARNHANNIANNDVTCLIDSVKNNYAPLSHRYYTLKAQLLNQHHLAYWDRLAPLPFNSNVTYNFDEAKHIILQAFGDFSPKMADIAKKFFTNNWIDAAPKNGKESGAFSHPMTPSQHPMILVNYRGTADCVMTLAHELGHGVHQYLARDQGPLLADTPLTLAETASIFAERLTFEYLYEHAQDHEQKAQLLGQKIEDTLNTVIRQIAFVDFELQCHDKRQDGELLTRDISAIWRGVNRQSLGDIMQFDDDFDYFWCYISHFFHAPFYVYSYAFGQCLVDSLYAHYQTISPHNRADFMRNYFALLEAGGSRHYYDLLAPFNLKPYNKNFWENGLKTLDNMVNMFTILCKN